MNKPDFVVMGEILKPHGIRGEVCVGNYADSLSLFSKGRKVWLRPGPRVKAPASVGKPARGKSPRKQAPPKAHILTSCRPHKGQLLMTFKDVPDRNASELLRGYEVLVRQSDLPEPDEGDLFLYEIEGLTVLLEDGTELGVITQVQLTAETEVWSIETEDKREVLFPVAEEFVVGADEEAGTITVAPPEGLLDIYLGD